MSFSDSPKSSPIKPRRFATKRFHNIWSAIKRFSPVHRIKDNTSNKKQKLIVDVKRLCASHPDISSCDLVGLAQVKPRKSRDDMDLILSKSRKIKDSLISTFCENGFMQEKLNRAQSQEDKTSKDDLTDMVSLLLVDYLTFLILNDNLLLRHTYICMNNSI